jgi:orotidine-5'-phosphate decarboxylase
MSTASRFANPIFCAIDRQDTAGAVDLARSLAGVVGGVKLGLEYFVANGPAGVTEVAATGQPIFLDLKLHDIPNTVAGAVRSACRLQPVILTLHAAGGRAMLQAAVEAAGDAATWLVGITVLTSLDDADLAEQGLAGTAADHVLRMAELAARSGLHGVVCSPREIATLRRRFGRDLRLVVPGIRAPGDATGDQKRTLPAAEAVALGADVLVVGRPITRASEPSAAAAALVRSLPEAA